MLEIELRQGPPGRLDIRASILDLRKQGFIPAGADLQSSGVIHDMEIRASIERTSRVIREFEPHQTVVAFEASAATAGESCRDIAGSLKQLVGHTLDEKFPEVLSELFGGPRGCSHLLTAAQFMGSSIPQALAWEDELVGADEGSRQLGERLFKRSIFLDGLESETGRVMDIVVQSNDIHTLPAQQVTQPMDRFLRQHEVQLLTRIDLESMQLASLWGQERQRDAGHLVGSDWLDRTPSLAVLEGKPALFGLARVVLENFGGRFPGSPLRDALLFVAPGLIQCMAANAGRLLESAAQGHEDGGNLSQVGGMPDSCYLWRSDGPGHGEGGLWDDPK